MTQSEAIGELAAALAKAQAEMTGVKKDAANPFFKSKYADLASVCEAARIITKYNLCIIQTVQLVGGAFVLETLLAHSSGQWKLGHYPLNPIKNDPQGMGSAVTYARRYSELAIINMAPEDDDGEAASNRFKNRQPEPLDMSGMANVIQNGQSKPTEAQLERLYAMSKTANWTPDEVKQKMEKEYNKKSAKDLTMYEYNKLADDMMRNKKPA